MSTPAATLLVYGATGYTGRLVVREAVRSGLRPIIAARNAAALMALAGEHGLVARSFTLDGPAGGELAGVGAVLNCAGPFSRTWRPLVEACLATGTHYIDVTGEIDVFEGIAGRDAAARAAGVMLLPGAGFDVVPSDCLAAHVSQRVPGAVRLMLGIRGSGQVSRGTAATMVENAGRGGRIRRAGRIVSVPAGWRTRAIDFGSGAEPAVSIPWGDVATAWYSTGIPDVEVYAAGSRVARMAVRVSRYLGPLLRMRAVQRLLEGRIRTGPAGPSERELTGGESVVWARAEDGAGTAAEARLHGPNGYALTAHAALLIARRALAGDAPAGFQTPSRAYGADLVLEVPGTVRVDVA